MDEKEKAAIEAKAAADKAAAEAAEIPPAPTAEELELIALRERAEKAEADRDNYKNVALKRLGKLPGDAQFLSEEEENGQLTVSEQVKKALLDKEIADIRRAEDNRTKQILRENAELKLALKNRPGAPLGGDSGASAEVKDNILSVEQIETLKKRALQLRVDPEKFIESAKRNLSKK